MAMQISFSPVLSSSSHPQHVKRKQTTIVECFKKARAGAPPVPLRDRPTADEILKELSALNLKSEKESELPLEAGAKQG